MTELFDDELAAWVVALAIALPLAIVVLGEAAERLKWADSNLERGIRILRVWFLPAATLLVVVVGVVGADPDSALVRIVVSVALVTFAWGLLALFHAIFIDRDRDGEVPGWRRRVPRLILQLPRVIVVIVVASYLLGGVWGVDLTSAAAALGIGSLVIALALQDTLSNLVSGMLLLADRPFTSGDWVRAGDLEGRVIDLNWRAARFATRWNSVVTVPNGALAAERIENFMQPDPIHLERIPVDFLDSSPPNKVREMLVEVATSTPGVLAEPPPHVHVLSYQDESVTYELRVNIDEYARLPQIRSEITARIWYARRRHDVAFGTPGLIVYQEAVKPDDDVAAADRPVTEIVGELPFLSALDDASVEEIAEHTGLLGYAAGEPVIRRGDQDRGLYFILAGSVLLTVVDVDGVDHEVSRLGRGDFFGVMTLGHERTSPVWVTAVVDTEVAVVSTEAVMDVGASNPEFADELNAVIEARRAATTRAVRRSPASGEPVETTS